MSVVVQQSPRRRHPPSYRLYKPTGQAVVTLNGKEFYLGVYDTPASREAYNRKIAEWLARAVGRSSGDRTLVVPS